MVDDMVDDDERYEAWRHPAHADPGAEAHVDAIEHSGEPTRPQYGGARGVTGSEAVRRQDEPGTPTRPPGFVPANARRYRGSGDGFRAQYEPSETRAEGIATRRADPRIREDVIDILVDDAFVDAAEIEVKVDHGEVELTGCVYAEHEKRRASDLAARVAGVVHVVDHLSVVPPGP